MRADDEREMLDRAAAETLARIGADHASAHWQLKPLLRYIEGILLVPGADIKQWIENQKVGKQPLLIRFHSELGLPPGAYLWDARLEISSKLLQDTDLSLTSIAGLTCFSSRKAFNNSFERWWGLRPAIYREKIREVAATVGSPPRGIDGVRFLQKLLTGHAETKQVELVFDYLQKISDESSRTAIEDSALERRRAVKVWDAIKSLPFAQQKERIRQQVGFDTSALFDLLRERSREEGRRQPQRGIEVAMLTLESLKGYTEPLEKDLSTLRAQAWAWIANAHRLANDFAGAEKALAFSEAEWESVSEPRDPLVAAEILENKAALLWFRRRFSEAIRHLDKAVSLLEPMQRPVALAQALVLRACINHHASTFSEAISDLRRALDLLNDQQDPYLTLTAYMNLSRLYIDIGSHEEAMAILPVAKALCEKVDDRSRAHSITWQEGLLKEAEGKRRLALRLLQEARAGFKQLECFDSEAGVTLDLAILRSRQGQISEVNVLVSEVLAFFEAFGIDIEKLGTLRLLRDAAESGALTDALLQRVRNHLKEIVLDISC